jgi:GH18 family chitinase
MKELRAALGTKYGLTGVLPQDLGYLQGIDVKSLAEYVDWFNVLTYDLHGHWDAKTPELGPKIRPHTDLKELDQHLNALWETGVKPSKFALGLAYYGRGYTAADPNCLYYGCTFTGPSVKDLCSNQDGILSNCEIKRKIKNGAKTNMIVGGAATKQLFWDNQWISYDDDETIALKKGLADEHCMSGTSIWAIDYDSCDGRSVYAHHYNVPV